MINVITSVKLAQYANIDGYDDDKYYFLINCLYDDVFVDFTI